MKLIGLIKKGISLLTGYQVNKLSSGIFVFFKQNECEEKVWSLSIELKSIIKRYDINLIFDIGANQGQFSKYLRETINYNGRIISFEPISEVFNILKKNAAKDPLWDVYNTALGSYNGQGKLNIYEDSDFSSFLNTSNFGKVRFKKGLKKVREEIVTIYKFDDFIQDEISDFNSYNSLLKIDTQGHEHEIIVGSEKNIDRITSFMFEAPVIPIYDNMDHWTKDIIHLEKLGFAITAMFPVNRDINKVIEFNCLMVKK